MVSVQKMMDEMARVKEQELEKLRAEHERITKEKEDLASAAAASGDDLLKRNEELQERLGAAKAEAEEAARQAQEERKNMEERESKVRKSGN